MSSNFNLSSLESPFWGAIDEVMFFRKTIPLSELQATCLAVTFPLRLIILEHAVVSLNIRLAYRG